MKLYLIKIKYLDKREVVNDEWVLALRNDKSVRLTMEKNADEFKKHGYEFLSYSYREIRTTDNGYKVKLEAEGKMLFD